MTRMLKVGRGSRWKVLEKENTVFKNLKAKKYAILGEKQVIQYG